MESNGKKWKNRHESRLKLIVALPSIGNQSAGWIIFRL
jgi:hypothetical protein